MNQSTYKPEGFILGQGYTLSSLERIRAAGQIIEGKALMCDNFCNLTVSLGNYRGIVPRELSAIGINEGLTKEIAVISRVNKQICFKVADILPSENGEPKIILDRASAQEEALDHMLKTLAPGDIVDAKITHLEPFGAFADIGCGIVGLLSIENISVSRINHPKDRFYTGQNIKTVIKSVDREAKRFTLSHKELLGTWQQNAELFSVGMTVCGNIRSVEPYGIFVELAPNLSGLAEYSPEAEEGQQATVYIKNIIPEKMKIKLNIIDTFYSDRKPPDPVYFAESNHISRFLYSPDLSERVIETVF